MQKNETCLKSYQTEKQQYNELEKLYQAEKKRNAEFTNSVVKTLSTLKNLNPGQDGNMELLK